MYRVFAHHPYPCRILLCLSRRDWRHLTREFELDYPYPPSDGGVTVFQKTGKPWQIAISFNLSEDRDRDEITALVAHECVHVLQRVEENIGGRLGDEGQAYLVQSLLLWILENIPSRPPPVPP